MSSFTGLALTTAVVAAGSTEARYLAEKKPLSMKPVIGGFVLGVFLFALGMASESVTRKFCYFIIITALLVNGVKTMEVLDPNRFKYKENKNG